ncbi:MAG: type II toxin-antitoxin system Phd/YefM family antitoxin [Candidatus Acidiferrales bacterium]
MIYNISTAQKNFEELVERALAGEEVILTRRNDPVVKLLPLAPRERSRKKRHPRATSSSSR